MSGIQLKITMHQKNKKTNKKQKNKNKTKKITMLGVPVVAQWLRNPTRNHEFVDSIPRLAKLAGGYSSNSTPSLGTSICLRSGSRNGKKKKKKKKKKLPTNPKKRKKNPVKRKKAKLKKNKIRGQT